MKWISCFIVFLFMVVCTSHGGSETLSVNRPVSLLAKSSTLDVHTLTFYNKCAETIWVGMAGNAKPGGGFYTSGGWEMVSDPQGIKPVTIKVQQGWQGRFWPRTGCNFDKVTNQCPKYPSGFPGPPCCDTGSCLGNTPQIFDLVCGDGQGGIPPASLFEFAFDAVDGYGNLYDTYDMSLVDGFNVPVQISPKQGTYNLKPDPGMDSAFWCKVKGCAEKPDCPSIMKYKDNKSCISPCMKATEMFNDKSPTMSKDDKALLCCDNSNITSKSGPPCNCETPGSPGCTCENNCFIGGYGCSPFGPGDDNEKCYATIPGKHGYWGNTTIGADSLTYIDNIQKACPTVYSWQFRDKDSTFHCRKTGGFVDYDITFCPNQ